MEQILKATGSQIPLTKWREKKRSATIFDILFSEEGDLKKFTWL